MARRPKRASTCVSFPDIPAEWLDEALAAKWQTVREVRRVVTGALELERAQRRIGASLQAAPQVQVTPAQAAAFAGLSLAEIAITSSAEIVVGEPLADAFRLEDVAGVGAARRAATGRGRQVPALLAPSVCGGRPGAGPR